MVYGQHWQVTHDVSPPSLECAAENDAADEADEWIDAVGGGFEPPDQSGHICAGTGRASALPSRSASASASRNLMIVENRAEGARHDAEAAKPEEAQRCAAGPAAADGIVAHREPHADGPTGSIPMSIDPSKLGPAGAAGVGQDRRSSDSPSALPKASPTTGSERHCTRESPATTDGRERVLMRDTIQ
jgi:hypothetical protein